MKKSLIALAVAASAVVSGPAMAGWNQGGNGGTLNFGGTLSYKAKTVVLPWMVSVGAGVSGLDAMKSEDGVRFEQTVKQSVPVLGLKSVAFHSPIPMMGGDEGFHGGVGLSPQINYGSAVDLKKFKNGNVPLELDVKNDKGDKIGKMLSTLFVSAEMNSSEGGIRSIPKNINLYAEKSGDGFFGGLATSAGAISHSDHNSVESLFPDILKDYPASKLSPSEAGKTNFADRMTSYNAFYAAGIKSGGNISIALNKQISGGEPVKWTASMPITVSYQ